MKWKFNRDMAINESEIIKNCNDSKGMISDKTILSHHPYVSDVEDEIEKLEVQKKEQEPKWDAVPPVKDGEGDGEE